MCVRTVFVCEANHADQAMRLAASLIVKKLANAGYNNLVWECAQSEIEDFYQWVAVSYNLFQTIAHLQFARIWNLSKECSSEYVGENFLDAEMELQITAFEAIYDGVNLKPFKILRKIYR